MKSFKISSCILITAFCYGTLQATKSADPSNLGSNLPAKTTPMPTTTVAKAPVLPATTSTTTVATIGAPTQTTSATISSAPKLTLTTLPATNQNTETNQTTTSPIKPTTPTTTTSVNNPGNQTSAPQQTTSQGGDGGLKSFVLPVTNSTTSTTAGNNQTSTSKLGLHQVLVGSDGSSTPDSSNSPSSTTTTQTTTSNQNFGTNQVLLGSDGSSTPDNSNSSNSTTTAQNNPSNQVLIGLGGLMGSDGSSTPDNSNSPSSTTTTQTTTSNQNFGTNQVLLGSDGSSTPDNSNDSNSATSTQNTSSNQVSNTINPITLPVVSNSTNTTPSSNATQPLIGSNGSNTTQTPTIPPAISNQVTTASTSTTTQSQTPASSTSSTPPSTAATPAGAPPTLTAPQNPFGFNQISSMPSFINTPTLPIETPEESRAPQEQSMTTQAPEENAPIVESIPTENQPMPSMPENNPFDSEVPSPAPSVAPSTPPVTTAPTKPAITSETPTSTHPTEHLSTAKNYAALKQLHITPGHSAPLEPITFKEVETERYFIQDKSYELDLSSTLEHTGPLSKRMYTLTIPKIAQNGSFTIFKVQGMKGIPSHLEPIYRVEVKEITKDVLTGTQYPESKATITALEKLAEVEAKCLSDMQNQFKVFAKEAHNVLKTATSPLAQLEAKCLRDIEDQFRIFTQDVRDILSAASVNEENLVTKKALVSQKTITKAPITLEVGETHIETSFKGGSAQSNNPALVSTELQFKGTKTKPEWELVLTAHEIGKAIITYSTGSESYAVPVTVEKTPTVSSITISAEPEKSESDEKMNTDTDKKGNPYPEDDEIEKNDSEIKSSLLNKETTELTQKKNEDPQQIKKQKATSEESIEKYYSEEDK